MNTRVNDKNPGLVWGARILISGVFIANLTAAVPFTLHPERFMHGFELAGLPGQVAIRSLGILFLMWNATFPPVILYPYRYRMLFSVMLIQQAIGLIGESYMWVTLPAVHANLSATGLRFILFDSIGLAALLIAYLITRKSQTQSIG